MNIQTKNWKLSRRSVLRGIGASIALPLLDCMADEKNLSAPTQPKRSVFLYIPNGVNTLTWQIEQAGADYQFSAPLASLERHRDDVTPISGLYHPTVTVTFFDGIDKSLFESFGVVVPEPLGWPTSGGAKDDLKPKGTLAVARSTLMTYDPLNDRNGGNILKTNSVPVAPSCSGVQIELQCGLLLEGYRPGEIVRFFPASWEFVALPKEEQFFGRE